LEYLKVEKCGCRESSDMSGQVQEGDKGMRSVFIFVCCASIGFLEMVFTMAHEFKHRNLLR
jgi:hypothetical protein